MTLLVARSLDLEDAGVFFIAVSSTLLFGLISRFGLDNAIMRSSALLGIAYAYRFSLKVYLSGLPIALVALYITSLAFPNFSMIGIENLAYIGAAVAFSGIQNINLHLYLGNKRYISSSLLTLSGPVSHALLLFLGLPYGDIGLERVLICYVLAQGLGAVLSTVDLCRKSKNVLEQGIETSPRMNGAFKFSLIKLTEVFHGQGVILMSALTLGVEQTALLGVAARLSSLIGYVNTAFASVAGPFFAAGNTTDIVRIKKVQSIVGVLQLIAITLCCFVLPEIIGFFGEGYLSGVAAAAILLFVQWASYYLNLNLTELQMGDEGQLNKSLVASLLRLVVLTVAVFVLYWLDALTLNIFAGCVLVSVLIPLAYSQKRVALG